MKSIAIVKNSGLASGGVERWLQFAAEVLSCDYKIYYLYAHLLRDDGRYNFLQTLKINLVDISTSDDSKNIDVAKLSEFFTNNNIDLTIVGKSDAPEYPYCMIPTKIINRVAFANNPDNSPNVIHTILPSEWLKQKWLKAGGKSEVSVIPSPVKPPRKFQYEKNAPNLNVGFHQRVDDNIFSIIPLIAYKLNNFDHVQYYIMGGSTLYQKYAKYFRLKNVKFLKHSSNWDDVSSFLSMLDIYAHGRKDGETYGAVFAEALTHGLPCISHTSKFDNAHVETIGANGFVAKNTLSYVLELRKLIKSDQHRREYSRTSITNSQRFTHDFNSRKLRQLVHSLINAE